MASPTDLMLSLMNLGGVAVPQQPPPVIMGENPMVGAQTFQGNTIPAATPAPNVSANPNPRQVRSLEEMLFGFGGGLSGRR